MAAMKRGLLVVVLSLSAVVPAAAKQRPEWRDTFESRLEILALLQSLNAEILAGSSATRTLEEWCGDHRMAADPKIVARRVPGAVPARRRLPGRLSFVVGLNASCSETAAVADADEPLRVLVAEDVHVSWYFTP